MTIDLFQECLLLSVYLWVSLNNSSTKIKVWIVNCTGMGHDSVLIGPDTIDKKCHLGLLIWMLFLPKTYLHIPWPTLNENLLHDWISFHSSIEYFRLDAKKLLIRYRRPIPQNVKDIGIWFDIMRTHNYIAVITNAFIIALTSDFIPQTVYRYVYSPNNTLVGYVNFTLSYVDTQDLDRGHINLPVNASGPQICR